MVDGVEDSGPRPIRKKGAILTAASAVILVALLIVAAVLASGPKVPEVEPVSGIASDFILNQSDMGADWVASDLMTGPVDDYLGNESVTSGARITFKQYNSTGQLEYVVELATIVFSSINNASAYYNKTIEIHPQDDSNIKPEYRPSYPVIIANVSLGDGGVILDLPRITLGHEAKALVFIDRNVVCGVTYHDATSYDPLPNELLIDLANKMREKIV